MEAIGLRSLAALLRLVPPSPRSGERACLRGPWDTARSGGAAAGLRGAGHGAVHPRGGDPDAADAASRARDILEFIGEVGLPPVTRPGALSVAYHAPCSLQHGHGIKAGPAELLAQAGYDVYPIAEGHLCCGSAGVYNILQPQIAGRLRDRKAANIARTGGAVVAAVNVGCIAQIAPAVSMPVVHPVELLDWATGGPRPAALGARRLGKVSSRPLSIPAPLKRP
jgi:glycolate oxidase iron-sulfur subunit